MEKTSRTLLLPRRPCFAGFATAMALVVLSLSTFFYLGPSHFSLGRPLSCHREQFSLSPPNANAQPSPYMFRPIDPIEDLDNDAATEWAELLSLPQKGFLKVQHNESLSVGWGISMYHGLHCLELLRAEIVRSKAMIKAMKHPAHYKAKAKHAEHDAWKHHAQHLGDDVHTGHCIAYIAQHLLCAGDDTIEPAYVVEEGGRAHFQTNGMDVVHRQCQNNDLIRQVSVQSEKVPFKPWGWQNGDTVRDVFGDGWDEEGFVRR